MKKKAIYSGIVLIVIFYLVVGLVGSTDEELRCDDWAGGCTLFGIEIAPPSNGSQITPPSEKKRIAVIVNSIDFELATEFFGFLGNKGIETVRVTASDFEQYKEEKFIVILGGPDAPEGVGSLVQEVLSEAEQNIIRKKGARKKYVKTTIWTQGQRVTVIAGSDRTETLEAENENKDAIASEVESGHILAQGVNA